MGAISTLEPAAVPKEAPKAIKSEEGEEEEDEEEEEKPATLRAEVLLDNAEILLVEDPTDPLSRAIIMKVTSYPFSLESSFSAKYAKEPQVINDKLHWREE